MPDPQDRQDLSFAMPYDTSALGSPLALEPHGFPTPSLSAESFPGAWRISGAGEAVLDAPPFTTPEHHFEQALNQHQPWRLLSNAQLFFTVVLFLALALFTFHAPLATAISINAILVAIVATANILKLVLIRRAHADPCQIRVSPVELALVKATPDQELPIFTVLVPLYHEADMLEQLIAGIEALDYPKSRLDVKMLCEADDQETRSKLIAMQLPSYFQTIIAPEGGIKGKPRACNLGLAQAKGTYLVIYDAEDRPESNQLQKVVAAFKAAPPSVVCLQAKLNYFNRKHNLLTRWFTAEYSAWFDQFLPALQSYDVAIPLGGTSNHFVVERLRALGGWNPYNVTEDADLGIRIYLKGWKTAILDTTTYEEANSRLGNWIRQRSRWVKGYMQTYLFQMRHPVTLYKAMGPKAFMVFQLFVGATALCLIFNPLYLALTVAWFSFHLLGIKLLFPSAIYFLGLAGFFIGNAAFIFTTMSGCVARRNYDDVKWSLLAPFYWLLMSVAAYKALYQLVFRPFYWEKTTHGYCPYVPENPTGELTEAAWSKS